MGEPLRHTPHCNRTHQLLYGSLKVKGEVLYSVVLRWSVGVDGSSTLVGLHLDCHLKYSSGLANRLYQENTRGQRVTLPVYAL